MIVFKCNMCKTDLEPDHLHVVITMPNQGTVPGTTVERDLCTTCYRTKTVMAVQTCQ